jgi:hypothetical protein
MNVSAMEALILPLFLYFFKKPLDISPLDSTNGPTRAPHSCQIQEVQNQMLHQIKEAE